MKCLLVVLAMFLASCSHTPNEPIYKLASKSKAKINVNIPKTNEKYWFYIRESQGGFYDQRGVHYSQIFECSQEVTTPGAFGKSHAVGPFSDYATALLVRREELNIALAAGKKLIQRTAVCDTRWD